MMTKIEMQAMDAVIGIHREMKKANEPDWEYRRYEIAKDSMKAMLSNPKLVSGLSLDGELMWGVPDSIASVAVIFADLLIAELQKEKA